MKNIKNFLQLIVVSIGIIFILAPYIFKEPTGALMSTIYALSFLINIGLGVILVLFCATLSSAIITYIFNWIFNIKNY